MRKLLSLSVMAILAGTVIATSSCVAAPGAESVPAKTVEVETKAPAVPASVQPQAKPATPAAGEMDWLSQQEARDQKPKDSEEQSTPVTVVKFILSLALVLGLCYATILGLKRFSNVKHAVGVPRGRIKVLENSSLGANRTLHLVEIGSKRLLVASTPSQVNLLAELEADDSTESAPAQPNQGFKEQLSQFLGNKADSTKSADTVAEMLRDSSSYIQSRVREVGSFRRVFRDVESG